MRFFHERGRQEGRGAGQQQQDHGRCAGKTGRAVEGLQQHHRIGAVLEAGEQVRQAELADRDRRHHHQPAEQALAQARQHDARELLPARGAQRGRSLLQSVQAEMAQVGQQRVGEVGQRVDRMRCDQQRHRAQPGQPVGVEHDHVAEAERDGGHRHRHGADDAGREAAAAVRAMVERIGQRQREHGVDGAGRERNHQAVEEGLAEGTVLPQVYVPLAGDALGQQAVGPAAARAADHQQCDRQQQVEAVSQCGATNQACLPILR